MLRMLHALENALMPRCCAFCGTHTRDDEDRVCDGCMNDLPWTVSQPTQAPFVRLVAPLEYAFPVDAAIKALKFRRRLFYGPAFAQLLYSVIEGLPDDVDAVLPVPLHWRRHWRRGFNQALEIARPVAKQLGLPVISSVTRRRATPPQSGLTAAERASNLHAAFVARRPIRHRHVLIVDDVTTTGATLGEIARTLLRAGATKVSALAVASA